MEDVITFFAELDTEGFQRGADKLQNAIKSFGKTVASKGLQLASKAFNSVKKIIPSVFNMKGLATGSKKLISAVQSFGKNLLSHGQKPMNEVLSTAKQLAPMLIGVGSVYGVISKATSTFLSQNIRLQKQMSAVWTSLGNLLGPIITEIIGWVTTAVSYFLSFLKLLGVTSKTASQLSKAANSAAGGLSATVAGFDELNKLQSGGTGAGTLQDFEPTDFMETLVELLQNKLWDDAANLIVGKMNGWIDVVKGKAEELGETISEYLYAALHVISKVINDIDWDGIGETIANFINGLFSDERISGKDLGSILVGKFTIAFEVLTSFLETLDSKRIAEILSGVVKGTLESLSEAISGADTEKIGQNIKTFFENIDWEGIKQDAAELLKTAWSGAIELLQGAFGGENVDLSGISGILSEVVTNVVNELSKLIGEADFQSVGASIKSFFENIDWESIKQSLSELLGTAWSGALELLQGILGGDGGEELPIVTSLRSFGEAVGELADSIEPILQDLWDNYLQPFCETTLPDGIQKVSDKIRELADLLNEVGLEGIIDGITDIKAILDSVLAVVGTIMGMNLLAKIVKGLTSIINLNATSALGKIAEVIALVVTGSGGLKEAVETVFGKSSVIGGVGMIIAGAITAFTNFFAMLKNGFSWIKEILMVIGIAAAAIGAIILGAPAAVAAVIAAIVAAVATAVVLIVEHWEEIKEFFKNLWQSISDWASQAWENIKAAWASVGDFFSGIGDKISEGWQKVKDWVSEKWQSLVDWWKDKAYEDGEFTIQGLLDGILEKIKDIGSWLKEHIFDPIVNGIKSLFGIASPSKVMSEVGGYISDGLLGGLDTFFDKAGEWLDGVGETLGQVKEKVSEKWEEIKAKTSEVWENVKEKVSSVASQVKENVQTSFSTVKEAAVDKWTSIKENISEKFGSAKDTVVQYGSEILSASKDAWENSDNIVVNAAKNIYSNVKSNFTDVLSITGNMMKGVGSSIKNVWNDSNLTTSQKVSSIAKIVSKSFLSISKTVTSKMLDVSTNVLSTFTGLVKDVRTWGADLIQNFINGLGDRIGNLWTSMSNIAQGIRNYIGFSEPEKGPLSNFHTYAPDMIDLFTKGIEENKDKTLDAVSDLAGGISDEIQNGEYSFGTIGAPEIGDFMDGFADKVVNGFADMVARMQDIADSVVFSMPVVAGGGFLPYNVGSSSSGSVANDGSTQMVQAMQQLEETITRFENAVDSMEWVIKFGNVRAVVQEITKVQKQMERARGGA